MRLSRLLSRPFLIIVLFGMFMGSASAQVPGLAGRVVFVSDRSGYQNLWTLDLVSGVLSQVTHFPEAAQIPRIEFPQWSNNGKQILFVGYTNTWRVYLINDDGSGFISIPAPGRAQFARWDPVDNNYIYYHRSWGAGTTEYHKLDLRTIEGPSISDVVIPRADDFYSSSGDDGFDVMTNGVGLLIAGEHYYDYSYFVYQDQSGNKIGLPSQPMHGRSNVPRINKNDGWIIFRQATGFPGYPPIDIVKMSGDFSGAVRITNSFSGEINSWPCWTNGDNNDYIIFDSNRSGNSELYAMKADPTAFPVGMIKLTDDPATDWHPDWTPTAGADALSEQLNKLKTIIAGLNPAALKNANMANALTNKIDEVLALVANGQYVEAFYKLQNDILKKTDGCTANSAPDKNDWIVDCASQMILYPEVMKAISFLEVLIGS